MFVADELVYLELQKTGGTHIRRLLAKYTNGNAVGKHNRLARSYADRFVVGSIRNPWDWYVSLWAYGVAGKGAIRSRTAHRLDFNYYHRLLPKAMGKNWLTPRELIMSLIHDAVKPVNQWQYSYADSSDPALFREWLRLLLDTRRRFDFGEGYGFSPLSTHAGLMTYRYFRLFTLDNRVFTDRKLSKSQGLAEFDREYNIAQGMIRTESLEQDFVRVLFDAGYRLSDDEICEIRRKTGGVTNVSQRRAADFYYDRHTIDLVAEREWYLIKKYAYSPPLQVS